MKSNWKLSVFVIIVILLLSYLVINKNGAKEALVLTEEQRVENMTAFAKLYGYVRYFHPSDEAADFDWDTFAVYGVQQVKDDKSAKELKETLETLFHPIAPSLKISLTEGKGISYEEFFEIGPEQSYVFWQHQGLETNAFYVNSNSIYKSERVTLSNSQVLLENRLFNEYPIENEWLLHKKISDVLHVYMPIVIPVNQSEETIGSTQETKMAFKELQNELAILKENGIHSDQLDARVSGVVQIWTIYQHFYPNLDVVDVNWEEQLPLFIQRVMHDETHEDYLNSLRMLQVIAEDAGSWVSSEDQYRYFTLPIRVKLMDDKVVISDTYEDSPFKVGDFIISKDGIPVEELISKLEKQIAGTPQYKKAVTEQMLVQGLFKETSDLEIMREGKLLNISSAYTERQDHFTLQLGFRPIREIQEGIYYVALYENIDPLIFNAHVNELVSADAIIFDTRYYSGGTESQYLLHLLDKPMAGPMMRIPQNTLPDQQGMNGYQEVQEILQPSEPKFSGDVVFLTDGSVSYWGEAFLMHLKDQEIGTFIGQPTAGTSGWSFNRIRLFDGIIVGFSGQQALKPDGTRHHLIGIQPDILVEQTMEAVKAGRDDYIERAIQFIEENSQ